MVDFRSRGALARRAAPAPVAQLETRNPAELSGRVLALATVVIAVVGVFLRVWQLGQLGFNSDEAVYAGQAASIVGHPDYRPIFPIFRAHPLLYQFSLALVYQFTLTDLAGRILAVVFGLAGLWFTYRAGNLLYGPRVGVVAALLLSVMPYHVVVTRQALLDGPMTTFAALTLYLVARYAVTEQPRWLYAAGAGLGLTFLAKETAVVFLPAIYAFLALSPSIRVRLRDLATSAGCFALVIAPFPLSLLLGGGTRAGKGFLAWQLFRPPNHTGGFYLQYVPAAVGLLVVLAAALALFLLRREWTWRENLLVVWIAMPVLFFQSWPVKGFQYLLPTVPAIVILAARALAGWPTTTPLRVGRRRVPAAALQVALVTVVAASLAASSWGRVNLTNSTSFLAGSGGVPGGRAAGLWLRDHVPAGAQMLALGPSMANILQFYSHQRVYGLSVSPNPLHRNPAYDPVHNPDRLLRDGRLQYLVWDSYSAGRSKFFADNLQRYVRRYRASEVHRETVPVRNAAGELVQEPVIIIYRVRQQ
jgi:4-amino-4-deoxy-L-arabinose transferase-like glycosyltransferase